MVNLVSCVIIKLRTQIGKGANKPCDGANRT